jgi:hypothetical protein
VVSLVGNPDLSPRAGFSGPILLNARAATRPRITGVERWTAEVLPRLRAAGLRRAARLSWERTAQRVAAVLRAVVGE